MYPASAPLAIFNDQGNRTMKKFIAMLALALTATFATAAVNVNTASQNELETLNGIGPAKAKAIIDYRSKNGPFKTAEDLDKVPGIGPGIMAKIRNDITLAPGAAKPAAAAPAATTAAAKPGIKPQPVKK